MKKNIFTFVIALIINTLCLAQKQWKYKNLEWCPSVLPAAMDLLLEKPRLKIVGDSVWLPYYDVIASGGAKWVRKPADKNCQSADPNDCLVWCLVEQPEVKTIRQRKVPFNNEEIIEIKKGVFIEKHYYDEAAIEIMCQEDAKPALQKAIIEALIKKKWLRKQEKTETEEAYKLFCESKFLNALIQFQQEEELPEGLWDLETLKALGIIELSFAQTSPMSDLPSGMDPNKCYGKCMVGGEYTGTQTKKQGKAEWREVICDTKINTAFLTKVQMELKKRGFTNEEFSNKIALMNLLFAFQRANDLPVGNFNMETLDRLGVFY